MVILITSSEQEKEIFQILMKILHSIHQHDYETYKKYSDKDLTCFEPESFGHQVNGLEFHQFFMMHLPTTEFHIEVLNPTIRVYNDTAYASYTILLSRKLNNEVKISSANETRIFHKENNDWKMVHFHRSKLS